MLHMYIVGFGQLGTAGTFPRCIDIWNDGKEWTAQGKKDGNAYRELKYQGRSSSLR